MDDNLRITSLNCYEIKTSLYQENKIQKIRENFVPELQINPQQHNITPL